MSQGEPRNSAERTIGGHPPGLFTLFFSEMWERFSYYGMRALLTLYLVKGFLGYGDNDAYTIYGAYTALVYMTPFFGGLLADRLLGARRAVVLGGVLMALGHLMMTVENAYALFLALGLLVAGNGFFKPNISTLVGSLYPPGSPRRDAGFTIFYMGINLGAAMSPLLCGYIGETYGWHYGFGLATIGMLLGVAVFVTPVVISQVIMTAAACLFGLGIYFGPETQAAHLINIVVSCLAVVGAVITWMFYKDPSRLQNPLAPRMLTAGIVVIGAICAAAGLLSFRPDNPFSFGVNIFVAISLLIAAGVAAVALNFGGLPPDAGQAPAESKLRALVPGAEWLVFVLSFAAVPVLALLVSGFAWFREDLRPVRLFDVPAAFDGIPYIGPLLTEIVKSISTPAGLVLLLSGFICIAYLAYETAHLPKVPRERMYVVFILTFFSMLFWSFFEQAGSSVNFFTDRNVDRVVESRHVTEADVGKVLKIQPTQENLGYTLDGEKVFTLDQLTRLRAEHEKDPNFVIDWRVTEDDIGMGIASRSQEIPASVFQSINPVYILLFGLPFSALWVFLARLKLEPSTPVKFALGLIQLGLGFGAFWWGAKTADERGMVWLGWLLLGYLLQTTGELCLSPVGLSMITKLSPKRLVSTVMGTWFLATAFSQYLAAVIAQFTGVTEVSESGEQVVPPPAETVHVYGRVFGNIAIAAMIAGLICFALSPLLTRWMHEGEPESE